jgi:hypothetical protein
MVAGACYGLVQHSHFLPRSVSVVESRRRHGAETATNSRLATWCPLSAAPAGAAANAGLSVLLPSVAGTERWLRCTSVLRLPPPTDPWRERGMRPARDDIRRARNTLVPRGRPLGDKGPRYVAASRGQNLPLGSCRSWPINARPASDNDRYTASARVFA